MCFQSTIFSSLLMRWNECDLKNENLRHPKVKRFSHNEPTSVRMSNLHISISFLLIPPLKSLN